MTIPDVNKPFWQSKKLEEMTREEWESLCDGCARCCLIKLENVDDGEVYNTQLVCHLLDLETCRCTKYQQRSELVPTCVTMGPEDARSIPWMPDTCAYRLLAEGKDLPHWHPLVSGSQQTVIDECVSIHGTVIPENEVPEDEWEFYITDKHE